MTDEKRLFDKPMDELSEAFIRNRFGQMDVFELAEIEHWLQHQRAVERPDETMWSQFLARDFLAMCAGTSPLTHLRERAETRLVEGRESDGPYWEILFQFRGGFYRGHHTVGIYAPGGTKVMFALDSDAEDRLTMERIGDANISVGAKAVVDVLFAEWLLHRPKWEKARQFLCDALAEEIKRERAKAEADFNIAVAVSADGIKIVHADWVVVVEQSERFMVFPAAAFRTRKMKRPEDRLFRRSSSHRVFVEGMANVQEIGQIALTDWKHDRAQSRHDIWGIQPDTPWAIFCDYALDPNSGKSGQRRTYVTSASLCPSPLPDGGVAVTA